MKALSSEPEIVAMANALRLPGSAPVQSIINFCRSRIAKWLEGHGPVQTIWDLEKLICKKLNLVIYEIWNDDDLRKLITRFVGEGDFVFAHLRSDLDEKTFATLIRRKSLSHRAEDRYVAVIDCRGKKGPRRFFSRWHEIAHLLTLYRQLEFPFHRSTLEKDATEKLMDIIAGEIGFYEPMFLPLLDREIKNVGRLTFAVVEHVRAQFCSDASFQSTLNACAARYASPVVLLEIGMGYKKTELRQLSSRQLYLLPPSAPKEQLRVINAMPNSAARKVSLRIPRYMRVPKRSILTTAFNAADNSSSVPLEGTENLHSWISSDGSALASRRISIQIQKAPGRLFAIIAPA